MSRLRTIHGSVLVTPSGWILKTAAALGGAPGLIIIEGEGPARGVDISGATGFGVQISSPGPAYGVEMAGATGSGMTISGMGPKYGMILNGEAIDV